VAELNVQNQQKFVWPATHTVGMAYLDQLERGDALAPARLAELKATMSKEEAGLLKGAEATKLAEMAAGLDQDATSAKTPADASRMHALAGILRQQGTVASASVR